MFFVLSLWRGLSSTYFTTGAPNARRPTLYRQQLMLGVFRSHTASRLERAAAANKRAGVSHTASAVCVAAHVCVTPALDQRPLARKFVQWLATLPRLRAPVQVCAPLYRAGRVLHSSIGLATATEASQTPASGLRLKARNAITMGESNTRPKGLAALRFGALPASAGRAFSARSPCAPHSTNQRAASARRTLAVAQTSALCGQRVCVCVANTRLVGINSFGDSSFVHTRLLGSVPSTTDLQTSNYYPNNDPNSSTCHHNHQEKPLRRQERPKRRSAPETRKRRRREGRSLSRSTSTKSSSRSTPTLEFHQRP